MRYIYLTVLFTLTDATSASPIPIGYATATLLRNGKVLVVGASGVELYDPSTKSWSDSETYSFTDSHARHCAHPPRHTACCKASTPYT